MKKSGYQYWLDGYGYSVGIKLQGQIGKRYIYRLHKNRQDIYPYYQAPKPWSPLQLFFQDLYRKAIWAWKALTETEKNFYRSKEPITPTMSGFNYYIKQYINTYK